MKNQTKPQRSFLLMGIVAAIVVALILQEFRLAQLDSRIQRLQISNKRVLDAMLATQKRETADRDALYRDLQALKKQLPASDAPPPPVDSPIPHGEWTEVSVEQSGRLASYGESAEKVSIIVEGDTLRTVFEGRVMTRMRVSFDASRTPWTMDATYLEGRLEGKLCKGIYKLEGDTWTYCLGSPDGSRPTEFASSATDKILMVVARRKTRP